MGFLGFLKKRGGEKKEELKELEIPSLPMLKEPADIYNELPTFPGAEEKEMPVLPPLESLGDAANKSGRAEPSLEQLPPIPKITEKPAMPEEELRLPEIKFAAEPGLEAAEPDFPEPSPEPRFEAEPKPETRKPEKWVSSQQPFVKAQDFRAILEGINHSVNACRETNRKAAELHRLEMEKEHKETQWHDAVEAMQRKLVFIDKTLFE